MEVNDSTINTGVASTTLPSSKTFNALALMSSANNLDITGGGILTLTSGGLLQTGGSDTR